MARYALIGRKLGHSWSQRWFTALFQRLGLEGYTYEPHETDTLDGLRQWVEREGIAGFNVTVPYKRDILPLLDALSPEAEAIGAVNCVTVSGGRLTGHNTDSRAFSETMSPIGPALVLGTGGAARAVAYALRQAGMDYRMVSRSPQPGTTDAIGYDEAVDFTFGKEPLTLINATPIGMWPDVEASPWPRPELLGRFRRVCDLVYNPSPTLLLRQAEAQGCQVQDGLAMLHRQAELSWQLWQRQ